MGESSRRDTDTVFVIYPETYTILKENLGRFDGVADRRLVAIVSAWEAAIEDHGEGVTKVVVYYDDDGLTFHAYEAAVWAGETGNGHVDS